MNNAVQMTLENKKEKTKLCYQCLEKERNLAIYAKIKIKTNPQYKDLELIEKKLVSLDMNGKIAFCSQECMGDWFYSIVKRILESEK